MLARLLSGARASVGASRQLRPEAATASQETATPSGTSPLHLVVDEKEQTATASQETVLFVHGWPDDERVWDDLLPHFTARFRCARARLPLHGRCDDPCCSGARCTGYDMDEIVDLLHEAALRACGEGKLILVVHDFGAIYGMLLAARFPELIRCVIALDIGYIELAGLVGPHSCRGLRNLCFFGAMYQWALCLCWLLQLLPLVGHLMRAACFCCRPASCYSYFYLHTRCCCEPAWRESIDWTRYPPQPTLFLHAAWLWPLSKFLRFYDEAWARGLVTRGDGSRALRMRGDHYFFTRRHPFRILPNDLAEVCAAIDAFLDDVPLSAAGCGV